MYRVLLTTWSKLDSLSLKTFIWTITPMASISTSVSVGSVSGSNLGFLGSSSLFSSSLFSPSSSVSTLTDSSDDSPTLPSAPSPLASPPSVLWSPLSLASPAPPLGALQPSPFASQKPLSASPLPPAVFYDYNVKCSALNVREQKIGRVGNTLSNDCTALREGTRQALSCVPPSSVLAFALCYHVDNTLNGHGQFIPELRARSSSIFKLKPVYNKLQGIGI